jgi:hypothetical protein
MARGINERVSERSGTVRRCYLWVGHEGRCIYRAPSGRPPWDGGNCDQAEPGELVAGEWPAELPEPEPLREVVDEPLVSWEACEAENPLERACSRLAVAGDDCSELAAGLALDALGAVQMAVVASVRGRLEPGGALGWELTAERFEAQAARAARLCVRLCRSAAQLRDLAEAVAR